MRHRNPLCFLLLAWALLLGPMRVSAAPEPPAMTEARRAVYGGALWRVGAEPASLAFFPRGTQLHVHEVFRAAYQEGGQDKLMLVYQLTPGPREQYRCDSCAPALGAAVLARDLPQGLHILEGSWRVQARAPLLMWGAAAEDLQLIGLGLDRWGLRSRYRDRVQNLESRRERLLLQQGERLLLVLDEGFAGKPAACGAEGTAPQHTALLPLAPRAADAPRLELVLRYNEGACPRPQVREERRRYELRDGRFQPE